MEDSLLRKALQEQEVKLRKLNQQLTDVRALQEQRDKVHALVSQMRFILGLPPFGVDERTEIDKTFDAINEPQEQPPLWRAAQGVLERAQQSMSLRAIGAELNALGYKLSDRTGLETIRSALNRKRDVFERVGRGKYAMKARKKTLI